MQKPTQKRGLFLFLYLEIAENRKSYFGSCTSLIGGGVKRCSSLFRVALPKPKVFTNIAMMP